MRLVSRPNVASLEALAEALDDQLALRRRELDVLASGIELLREGVARDARTRACWVLLYAHWEGFVKAAVACYMDLFNSRGALLSGVHTGLRAVALRRSFSDLPGRSGLGAFLSAAEEAWGVAAVFRVDPDKMVRHTWEQMDWSALGEAFGAVGGGMSALGVGAQKALGELVQVRNWIAHGDLVSPDAQSFQECRRLVEQAMVALQRQVMDSAVRQVAALDAVP